MCLRHPSAKLSACVAEAGKQFAEFNSNNLDMMGNSVSVCQELNKNAVLQKIHSRHFLRDAISMKHHISRKIGDTVLADKRGKINFLICIRSYIYVDLISIY